MRRTALAFVFHVMFSVSLLSSSSGCSDPAPAASDPEPVCVDAGVDTSCTPPYEPTFDALYTNTFQRSCAASGVSCHASTGKQGGVDFGDPDAAYAALTKTKVRAGQPECSVLVQRVIATDGKVRMPPGRALTSGEQCAIIQWVAQGAHR